MLLETVDPTGPFGAEGIREPPIIAVVPAIANAVYIAVGVRMRELPIISREDAQGAGQALESIPRASMIRSIRWS